MAKYQITAPDGANYEIEAPDSATEQEVLSYAQSQWQQPQQVEQPKKIDPTQGFKTTLQFGPLDTGVELPESVSVGLAGMGKRFRDIGTLGAAPAQSGDTQLMARPAATVGAIGADLATALAGGRALAGIGGAMGRAGAIPAAIGRSLAMPKTAIQAGLGGLGYGLATTQGDITDRATAGAFGLAGGMALPTLQAAGRVTKALVRPLTKTGQQKIAGEILQRFAGQNADDLMRAAQQAPELVPGSVPTLAEATGNQGIATLQAGLTTAEPTFANALAQRQAAQRAARMASLQSIAGDDVARQAAIQARKQASAQAYAQVSKSSALADPARTVNLIDRIVQTNPANKALVTPLQQIRESLFEPYPLVERGSDAWSNLTATLGKRMSSSDSQAIRDARVVMDRIRKGSIDSAEALSQLKGITATSKTAQEAIESAKGFIKTPDFVLRQSPQHLKSAVDNIKTLMANQDNKTILRELQTVKKSLSHQISKVEPAYLQAEKAFAKGSIPINQMDIGQALANKLAPGLADFGATTRETAATYGAAMRNADELARKALGFKRAKIENVLTPDQMRSATGVAQDLARKAFSEDLARGLGSNTAKNLATKNLLRQVAGPLGLPESFAESQFLGPIVKPIDWVYGNMAGGAMDALSQSLLDPRIAQQAVAAASQGPGLLGRGYIAAQPWLSPALMTIPASFQSGQ